MIIIIGGGISGLLTGYRLKLAGIPFKILEARDRLGGRVNTIKSHNTTPVEMGATWFGNRHINLIRLLLELDLLYFEQYMQGTSFFQPFSTSPVSAIPIADQSVSYRISGGTSTLINALTDQVGSENIVLNSKVDWIDFSNEPVVHTFDKSYHASKVVLALPPKLWANNIMFSPALPVKLKNIALTTHTWMEESVKVALTYQVPFWRLNKQSGTLFSNAGPLTELYDHCNASENKYALCGFVNPAFGKASKEERKELIVAQLTHVFGSQAKAFTDYNELAWSNEEHTFAKNLMSLRPHQHNGHPIYREPYFNDKLFISSSEASAIFAGYMEGAVVSAEFASEQVKNSLEYSVSR